MTRTAAPQLDSPSRRESCNENQNAGGHWKTSGYSAKGARPMPTYSMVSAVIPGPSRAHHQAQSPPASIQPRSGPRALTRPTVSRVTDWLKFYTWVQKRKAFDSLARRLNQANLSERFEHDPKLVIPGLERVAIVKVTATAKR